MVRRLLIAFPVFLTLCSISWAQRDDLAEGFQTPPDSAKPRVWWHWMNGNITKEGIKLDLEWMKRSGIGGFQTFDAALGTPQLVDKRLPYMTPEWKDAFRYTTTLADQLGLEEAIAGSPGWSESGGPWVQPQQAMKKYVFSETHVVGGSPFHGMLPRPPGVSGPFQDIPLMDFIAALSGQETKPAPDFYRDAAVIAFKLPVSDISVSQLKPRVTLSSGNLDANKLWDGDLVNTVSLPMAPVGKQAWIRFEFDRAVTLHALTVVMGGMKNPFGPGPAGPDLESSSDGQVFQKIGTVPGDGAASIRSRSQRFRPNSFG